MPDKNQWNQVDDFQWLKPGQPSPNWRALGPGEGVEDQVWRKLVEMAAATDGTEDGQGQAKVDNVLRAVGVGMDLCANLHEDGPTEGAKAIGD